MHTSQKHKFSITTLNGIGYNSIVLCGKDIPIVPTVKYRGIYLDRKLLWGPQIDFTVNRCEKGINFLKMLCESSWSADQAVAMLFYRAYIRSIIDYGSILYGADCNSKLIRIDKIRYKALKMVIGLMTSTPNEAEPPSELRREYLSTKYIIKQNSRANHIYNITSQK